MTVNIVGSYKLFKELFVFKELKPVQNRANP
jgi:hypothetical protein